MSDVDSDSFLDMPLSSQALYFHLGMRADDDGFTNSPRKIQKMVGAADDDLRLLIARGFVIPFQSGVVVIRHWRLNNYIPKDRYKGTIYTEEMALLDVGENRVYTLLDTTCIQNVSGLDTQTRIDKIRLEEDRKEECIEADKPPRSNRRFVPPSVDEVRSYCQERGNHVDPEQFHAYYESIGWKVGRNPMKSWKSSVITWERREGGDSHASSSNNMGETSELVLPGVVEL